MFYVINHVFKNFFWDLKQFLLTPQVDSGRLSIYSKPCKFNYEIKNELGIKVAYKTKQTVRNV